MGRRTLLSHYRHLFLLLVGLGLLVRVLVPVGWMPHVSNGDVRLVLCGGYGPVVPQVPMADHHTPQASSAHAGHDQPASQEDRQTEMGSPCPFTLASASAVALDDFSAVTPLLPVAAARWTAFAVTRASRLAAPPPPAIGPPTT